MAGPRSIDLPALALDVVERADANAWSVLVAPAASIESVGARLAADIVELSGVAVRESRVNSGAHLLAAAGDQPEAIAVMTITGELGGDDWSSLDQDRSRLECSRAVVLVMSPESVAKMVRFAPNLLSWIGGSVWCYQEAQRVTDDERDARLVRLRERFGLTDEEVIGRAEKKELSPEPDLAEWLILLGRGDLLERR